MRRREMMAFLQRVQKFATGFEHFHVCCWRCRPSTEVRRWCFAVEEREKCMRQAEQCAIQLIISAFLHLNNNNWSVVGQFCCSVVVINFLNEVHAASCSLSLCCCAKERDLEREEIQQSLSRWKPEIRLNFCLCGSRSAVDWCEALLLACHW